MEISDQLPAIYDGRCSPAHTLRIPWLAFGRQQLLKGPDVIGDPSRHPGCTVHCIRE